MNFGKAKDFYQRNKHKINPVIALAKACVLDVTRMREKSNIADYIHVGFAWKENYDEIMGPQNPIAYFDNENWQPFFNGALWPFLIELINHTNAKSVKMIKNLGNDEIYIAEIKNFRFGWASNGNKITYFCVEKNGNDKAFKLVEEMFWTQHASGKVIIGVDKEGLSIKEDLSHKDFIKFKKCTDLALYVNEFYKKGVSRSILFYGPPGSGKSNLVKGITYCLASKTIRFMDLSNINSAFVAELLRVFNPDSIVLEDIDHMSQGEIDDLLDKLEDFSNQKKLTFATANQVSKLDNALLRPGRFDEVKEINHLDEEVLFALVNQDKELFEITRKFPVAFTVELLKRIQVLGKAEALRNMQDIIDRVENLSNTNYELRSEPDLTALIKRGPKIGLRGPFVAPVLQADEDKMME